MTQRPWLRIWLYLALVASAELLISFYSASLGLSLDALLILLLTGVAGLGRDAVHRRLALALVLVPVARTLALALPLAGLPRLAWYPAVLAPLAVAAYLAARQLKATRATLGIQAPSPLLQLMLLGGGLGIGMAQYTLLPTNQLASALSWNMGALASLLLLTVGVAEEVYFQGLLRLVVKPILGRWSLVYLGLLFAALHISYLAPQAVLLSLGVGLVLSYAAQRSDSIIGVAFAHGLANATAFVFLPLLTRFAPPRIVSFGYATIAAASFLAVIALVALLVGSVRAPRPSVAETPFHLRLRSIRRERSITYIELAANTGIPARVLAEIEHGLRPSTSQQRLQIAQALGNAASIA